MEEKICIADGIEADSLIGETVYFEAKRTIRTGDIKPRRSPKRRGGAKKPFYDLIPGTVVHAASGRVAMEVAGGTYCRNMADIIQPEDLDVWISRNPDKWVMRGDQ